MVKDNINFDKFLSIQVFAHGLMNIILFFLVFSSVGGFPLWKIVVIFQGQDVLLAIYKIYINKKNTQKPWTYMEGQMVLFFGVFLTIIIYANKKYYFANDENNFYINIFEISFASIMMRWGNQMTGVFV